MSSKNQAAVHRVVINPVAGTARLRERALRAVCRHLERLENASFEIFETRGRGDAARLASEAARQGATTLIAVGGDGTVNEVSSGLLGSQTALGIVRAGSGNGLARHLRIPAAPAKAVDLILGDNAQRRRIDVGVARNRVFLNVLGLGLDAEIGRRFNLRGRRGALGYFVAAWELRRRFRPRTIVLRHAGSERRLEVLLAAVANSSQYGNGARIAPLASVEDGLLDFVAVAHGSLPALALDLVRLFRGDFHLSPRVQTQRLAALELESPESDCFHVDGEIEALEGPLQVALRPAALTVCVPLGKGGRCKV